MMRKQYHYLVSGLPGISIGERLWTSMAEFRAQLEVHLHPEDFIQVKYILLQQDHQNLLHYLRTGEIPGETAGNFSLEDFSNPENHISGTDPETEFMPGYIVDILLQHARSKAEGQTWQLGISAQATGTGNNGGTGNSAGTGNSPGPGNIADRNGTGHRITEGSRHISGSNSDDNRQGGPDLASIQKQLDEGFFRLVMERGNDFLRGYYAFHYDLNNLLAFIKSGMYEMDQQAHITADTPHAQHLQQYAGRTLAKDPEMEYFDEITSISGNPSFSEEEKQIDQLRWQVIEDMNRFEYFTIDRILGYLLQMQIAGRWEQLDRESGEQQLRKLIDVSYRNLAQEQRLQEAGAEQVTIIEKENIDAQ